MSVSDLVQKYTTKNVLNHLFSDTLLYDAIHFFLILLLYCNTCSTEAFLCPDFNPEKNDVGKLFDQNIMQHIRKSLHHVGEYLID